MSQEDVKSAVLSPDSEGVFGTLSDGQLNTLVAEKIMGEPKPSEIPADWEPGVNKDSPLQNWFCASLYENGDEPFWIPVGFAFQIREAWRVVEKLRESRGLRLWVAGEACWFQPEEPDEAFVPDKVRAKGANIERAICVAALKAIHASIR
jgi:hypothetical protein